MILAHSELTESLHISDFEVTEWIVESPELFIQYLNELSVQINGQNGRFVLSRNDKELNISKSIEIIFSPFLLEINEKKVLSKIYLELQDIANDENTYLKTRELVTAIHQYFLDIEQSYSMTLSINDDIDLQSLFKLLGVKIEVDSLSLFEILLQYMKLQTVLLNKKLIILVNTNSYLTETQIQELCLFSQHNEINILLYESYQRYFTKKIKTYIIDTDKYEI